MLKLTTSGGVTFYARAESIDRLSPVPGGAVLHMGDKEIYVLESIHEIAEMMK